MNNKKIKTIIAVGFRLNSKKNYFTGQAAMIDLFINITGDNGYKVIPVSLNYKLGGIPKIGKASFFRTVDYFRIFSVLFFQLLMHPGSILYFSPVSNKAGFIRDAIMVYVASFLRCGIFMQQFGCRTEQFYKSVSDKMQKLIKQVYNRATIITVEGDITKKQLQFLDCDEKIVVVNNGLPERNIIHVEEGKKIDLQKPFKLLFLNNMIEAKGYLDVLKAVDILVNKHHKNIEVVFAGKFLSVIDDKMFKTPEHAKKYFFNYIKSHNLLESVIYYDGLYGEKKAKEFLACNVFLLPTYYTFEGQPTAILEALAYGAVPIVTKHGLIGEIVNEDCGRFVKKSSPDSIVFELLYLMNNPDEYNRLSLNSVRRFKNNYTVEKYSKEILHVLDMAF